MRRAAQQRHGNHKQTINQCFHLSFSFHLASGDANAELPEAKYRGFADIVKIWLAQKKASRFSLTILHPATGLPFPPVRAA